MVTESEKYATEFELVIGRDSSYEVYQGVFHNFPELDEWSTKDVFRKHPSIDNLWEYRFRVDYLVVFSTSEKMNPVPKESHLNGVPGVGAGLAIGNERSFPGILLDLDGPDHARGFSDALPAELEDPLRSALKIENGQSSDLSSDKSLTDDLAEHTKRMLSNSSKLGAKDDIFDA